MRIRGIFHTLGVAAVLAAVSSPASAQVTSLAQLFQVNPQGSYLRADGPAGMPLILDLGLTTEGRQLTLTPNGNLQVAGPYSPWHDAGFCAVFSSSSTLLPQTELNRVVDAIMAPAGPFGPYGNFGVCLSGPTFYGHQLTDIAEDFNFWSSGTVEVPTAARFLFVAVPDDYYPDNYSPNPSQYGVYASMTTVTPEPVTMLLLGTGLFGVAGARLRRRKKDRHVEG